MRLLILIVCAILISCERVSLTPLPLQPCHVKGLAEEIRCGMLDVFEDRDAKAGRQLSIHIAVLPALRRAVDADPLVIFAGGPGQGARGMAGAVARFFKRVRRSRDIVLVDLRGTGGSAPLRCPDGADELADLTPQAITAQVRACHAAIEANVRYYTHEQSLQDVDEIRHSLGYDRINLWGGSWGTRAALLYALRFPAATRSVVLDGAVPLDLDFPRTASADAGAALDRLIADCQADAGCGRAFPDPRALLAAFDKAFDRGPVTARIRHPRSALDTTVVLSRGLAAEMIRGALYVPRDATAVLRLVEHAANGNFAPLAAQYLRTASWSTDDMALGATHSILCSEDLPRVTTVDFASDAHGSFFRTGYADAWRARCGRLASRQRDSDRRRHGFGGPRADSIRAPRPGDATTYGPGHGPSFPIELAGRRSWRRTQRLVQRLRAGSDRPLHRGGHWRRARHVVREPRDMAVIRRGRRWNTAMIQLDAIQKRYGQTVAVRDVSLLAPNGLVTGLLGPNGAGKTTVLRAITGLIRPDAGRAMVDGLDVSAQPRESRAKLGVVPESAGTYDRLTVREHVAYSGELHGLNRSSLHRRVDELLDQLGLTALAARYAGGLSLGERRRLALARALVHDPGNLVLDEPTNGLDVMSARAVRQEIRRRAAAGGAVLVSSHVMPEVAAMCDRVVVLANGLVAAAGTPAELVAHAGCATLEEAFVRIIGSDEGLN